MDAWKVRLPDPRGHGLRIGDRVVVRAPVGAVEVDGVLDGTLGTYAGTLTGPGGQALAAVDLRHSDESVYVRPSVVEPIT